MSRKQTLTSQIAVIFNSMSNVHLNFENIDITQSLSEVGIDSLQLVNFILAIEEFYGIELINEDVHIDDFINIENIVIIVDKALEASNVNAAII